MIESPEQLVNMFNAVDINKRTGKKKQARAFNVITYLDEIYIQEFITQNRKKIRSYAYALHDKDVTKDGELKEPHRHIVFRMYSQYSRERFYKLWYYWLWEIVDSQWKLKPNGNIELEICQDYKGSFEYLIHKNNPDKYQYDPDIIVTDDETDFGEHDDKCKDGSFEIVNDMLDGKSQLELLKKYGKEYVYHKRQYLDIMLCITYEENEFIQKCQSNVISNRLLPMAKREHQNSSDAEILNELRRILSVEKYY